MTSRDAVGNCYDQDHPDAWFPLPHLEPAAKRLCAGCPVQTSCLKVAMSDLDLEGIWGGTTTNERRGLSNSPRAPKDKCSKGHAMTEENSAPNGPNARVCRTCRDARNASKRAVA